jgi:hypothetical protein
MFKKLGALVPWSIRGITFSDDLIWHDLTVRHRTKQKRDVSIFCFTISNIPKLLTAS